MGLITNFLVDKGILPGQLGPKKAIQEFIAQVKSSGIARTNRYAVFFSPPPKVAPDRKSTRLNSSHMSESRMPSSA